MIARAAQARRLEPGGNGKRPRPETGVGRHAQVIRGAIERHGASIFPAIQVVLEFTVP